MQVLDGLEPFPTRSDYFFKQNIIPIYNTILTVVDQLTSHDFPNLKTSGLNLDTQNLLVFGTARKFLGPLIVDTANQC